MRELAERIHQLNSEKVLFADHNTFWSISRMLKAEVEELIEAADTDPDNAFAVASELGDIGYLWLWLCAESGIDPQEVVEWKSQRNQEKYPVDRLKEGDFHVIVKQLWAEWEAAGGDESWELGHSESTCTSQSSPLAPNQETSES